MNCLKKGTFKDGSMKYSTICIVDKNSTISPSIEIFDSKAILQSKEGRGVTITSGTLKYLGHDLIGKKVKVTIEVLDED